MNLFNPQLSQERWFFFFVYYTDLRAGRSTKMQLIAFFGEQFQKSHENLKKIIFQSHVSDHDKKNILNFLIAILAWMLGAIQKKQNYSFFREAL